MAMGSMPKGTAAYKKKDGILTVTGDHKSIIWTPSPGTGPPVVSLSIANIMSEDCSGREERARLQGIRADFAQIFNKPRTLRQR
jgi:hypothetical protein